MRAIERDGEVVSVTNNKPVIMSTVYNCIFSKNLVFPSTCLLLCVERLFAEFWKGRCFILFCLSFQDLKCFEWRAAMLFLLNRHEFLCVFTVAA